MTATNPRFYTSGGTVPIDSPSYIERRADRDLYEGLRQGEFCYILTSRQMGKSSMMVRAALRLGREDVRTAIADLTWLGTNLTVEQWYWSLCSRIGVQLNLEDEFEEFWEANRHLSPLQRWMETLQKVGVENHTGPLVIFIDEIDFVRSLPFSTDEFFAAIRGCYNRRAGDADYARLTFCLLGVAAPTDLIRDTRMTPFNIGRRIELDDFSKTEAAPLAQGLNPDPAVSALLLERILYWTGGHPYLTQKFCQAVAESGNLTSLMAVDSRCSELFFTGDARETEHNLVFVSSRILGGGQDIASLLDLYRRIESGKTVSEDETSLLVNVLKLSGIVRTVRTKQDTPLLKVRNRIYRRIFDKKWIQVNMPGTAQRRLQQEFWRGVLRTVAWAAPLLLLFLTLATVATVEWHQARNQTSITQQYNYVYGIYRSQRLLEEDKAPFAITILDRQPVEIRGFEWRYLWHLSHGYREAVFEPQKLVFSLALSPDGKTLAIGCQDGAKRNQSVRIWDRVAHHEIKLLAGPREVLSIAFSPDGRLLAAGGGDTYGSDLSGEVRIWETETWNELPQSPIKPRSRTVQALVFSQDSRILAISGPAGGPKTDEVLLWNVASRQLEAPLKTKSDDILCLALSPDSASLLIGDANGKADLWNLKARTERRNLYGGSDESPLSAAQFSRDGKLLAICTGDTVRLWDTATWSSIGELSHPAPVHALAFSADGTKLATGCWDSVVRIWNVPAHKIEKKFFGHRSLINAMVFSLDGKSLISGGNDGMMFWDTDTEDAPTRVGEPGTSKITGIALTRDGRMLASVEDNGTVSVWDVVSGRRLRKWRIPASTFNAVSFSPDGRSLAAGGGKDVLKLRNSGTGESIGPRFEATGAPLYSGDGKLLYTGNHDLMVSEAATGNKRNRLHRFLTAADCYAISPDGDTLAMAGTDVDRKDYGDGTIELWSLSKQHLLSYKRGAFSNNVTALAFSPDGKTLAAGGFSRQVEFWNLSQGLDAKLRSIYHESAPIRSLAFSQDGKTLAVGCSDGAIGLWNCEIGEEMATLHHKGAVRGLAFSADGTLLVSGSDDGTARFWYAPPAKTAGQK